MFHFTHTKNSITAYALRRNFIQTAQKVTDDKKVAVIAGHQASSLVQYKKYGNSFSSLDVVKIIQENTFDELLSRNKYIEGIYSVAKIYSRLSKQEYKDFVETKLREEKTELDTVQKLMKKKYIGLSKECYGKEDFDIYTKAYKAYKNKQDSLRRKAMKVLSEARRKEALESMKVEGSKLYNDAYTVINNVYILDISNCDEDVEITNRVLIEEMNDLEETHEQVDSLETSSEEGTIRALSDDRATKVLLFSATEKHKIVGKHNCHLCLDERGESVVIEGHSDHVRHLFKSLLSPTWRPDICSKIHGQHTKVSRYIHDNVVDLEGTSLKCKVCGKNYSNKDRQRSMNVHMKKHMREFDIVDLSEVEAKEYIDKYLQKHFDIKWATSEFDELIAKRENK